MKKLFSFTLLMCLLVSAVFLQAQNTKIEKIQKGYGSQILGAGSNAQGYEFIVAFPQNEIASFTSPIDALFIFVSSAKPTVVEMQNPVTNSTIFKKRITKPYGVISFRTPTELNMSRDEIRIPYETPQSGKAYRIISSSSPISVYCFNTKDLTSDGYMAIPVAAWGTDYIHACYYDNNEGTNDQGFPYFGSGFVILASENNTTVNIELKGKGGEYSTTTSGKKIGDKWSVTLNRGQVYVVRGMGNQDGTFDLTGSRIKSDKPIGLLSYHQRADLPALISSSRDHLIEMIPPVQSWGKTYASVQYARPPYKGDMMRIVAAENMTSYEVEMYDEKTGQLIERRDGTLKRSGDFVEISEVLGAPGPNTFGVRGLSIVKANKPILVLQYSYSSGWDGNNNYDPFMIVNTSVEQFTNLTIFQTPSGQFNDNWFAIIAIGDPDDPIRNKQLIESITIDNKPIYQTVPQFKSNNIPGTNLFWARLKVGAGSHVVRGDTPFGGYVYGFTNVDSYGWPAAMQFKITDVVDTLEPEVYIDGYCGSYTVRFTELRNGKEGDDPLQQDLGVSDQPTLLTGSYNFKDPIFPKPFTPYPPNYDFTFNLEVNDLSEDALAIVSIMDRAGNEAIHKIEYFADKLASNPALLAFETVRVGSSKELNYIIQNKGKNNVSIKSIKLYRGQYYSLVDLPELPTVIAKNSQLPIKVRYSPINESPNTFNLDIDSIIVETECLRFSFPMTGRGVLPKINVTDWDAGTVLVGDRKCNTVGITIRNTGSQDLVIDGFNWNPGNLVFTIEPPVEPEFPVTIPPGGSVLFRTVCFTPTENGQYTAQIDFISNAASGKYWSNIKGSSIKPGPMITNFNWGARRVMDDAVPMRNAYDGYVEIYNIGTASLKFLRAEIDEQDNDGSYEVIGYEPDFISTGQTQIEIWPENDPDPNKVKRVRALLRFKPTKENVPTNVKIYPIFSSSDNVPRGSIYGILEGSAYLPKIEAIGYEFTPPAEIGNQHPDQGKIVIRSTSTTADLFIKEIRIRPITPNADKDFTFGAPLPTNFTLKQGEALEIPVTFTPTRTLLRQIDLDIVNDAFKAYDSIQTTTISVIGNGYDQSFEVTNVDFQRRTRCDEPILTFDVRNTGTTNPFQITNISVEDNYSDIFEVLGFTPGDQVQPQDAKTYNLRFKPTARPGQIHNNGNKIKVKLIVETTIGTYEAEVQAMSVWSQVELSMPRIDQMTAGMTTTDKYKEFPVSIKLAQDNGHLGTWPEVKITEFTVEIKYNPKWMKYNGSVTPGDVLSNWVLTAKEVIHSENSASLFVHGKGGLPISKDGKLFNPNFLILLSDSSSFTPTFGSITFHDRDNCVSAINVPGRISLQHCVQDLRNVIINKNQFKMLPINPNPVSGGSVNLNFSVGLDNVYTRIEIVNSQGEVVRVLQDGEMRAGDYTATIITSELGSGIYFINMTSGPFSAREKLVIVK